MYISSALCCGGHNQGTDSKCTLGAEICSIPVLYIISVTTRMAVPLIVATPASGEKKVSNHKTSMQ